MLEVPVFRKHPQPILGPPPKSEPFRWEVNTSVPVAVPVSAVKVAVSHDALPLASPSGRTVPRHIVAEIVVARNGQFVVGTRPRRRQGVNLDHCLTPVRELGYR